MAKITLINDDASNHSLTADMIVTDPPFEMTGQQIHEIISKYNAPNLLLICSLRQLIEFANLTNYKMGFDFVLDLVAPKQSKSQRQPNYIHAHAVYFYKSKSVFNRKHGERSDVFTKGYCQRMNKQFKICYRFLKSQAWLICLQAVVPLAWHVLNWILIAH